LRLYVYLIFINTTSRFTRSLQSRHHGLAVPISTVGKTGKNPVSEMVRVEKPGFFERLRYCR